MHNDRMRLPCRPAGRLPGRVVGLTAVLALVLTGCGADGETPDGDADPTGTPSAEPYLPVPDGVELTPQGSELAVGDTGTVAFELSQGKVGALEITVTSLEKASFDLFVGYSVIPALWERFHSDSQAVQSTDFSRAAKSSAT